MKNSHANIPVFIPHLGCPNMCVFCNQRTISGVCTFERENVRREIEEAIQTAKNSKKKVEIAFFGGSFTGIERGLMIYLLELAEEYVKSGDVVGIRMSTRPDYIDGEIVSILSRYTVTEVELGLQSFSDKVLLASKRGHTAEDSRKAVHLLREAGFSVVGQMMVGLPSSTEEDEIYTAEMISSLGCKAARVYPTVVFRDTEMYEMTVRGEYTPMTPTEAVERSASVVMTLFKNGVECRRVGLCESENLHSDKTYFSGPNHPSLGELVYGEVYFRVISALLDKMQSVNGTVEVTVPRGDLSQAIGQKGINRKRLCEKYGVNLRFKEEDAKKFDIRVSLT